MTIAHLLEDFSVQLGGGSVHLLDDDALEEQRLSAFEKGYGAGWEDASQAQEHRRGQLNADLASALSDMSFTYHEAVTQMAQSLAPMFQALMQTILPQALDQGFVLRLSEQLSSMAQEQMGQPMQVLVPVGMAEQVEAYIPDTLQAPLQVIEDSGLKQGQARLQVGVARRDVDCTELLSAISDAFDAYLFEARKVSSNE